MSNKRQLIQQFEIVNEIIESGNISTQLEDSNGTGGFRRVRTGDQMSDEPCSAGKSIRVHNLFLARTVRAYLMSELRERFRSSNR